MKGVNWASHTPHRTRTELLCETLYQFSKENPTRKTRLIYGARINHVQANKFLALFIKNGLVRVEHGRDITKRRDIPRRDNATWYYRTQKGYEAYQKLREHIQFMKQVFGDE